MDYFARFLVLVSLLAAPVSARAAEKTLIFIGGNGGAPEGPTLKSLEKRLQRADLENTTVVFTGDYAERDMPGKGSKARSSVEASVRAHLDAVRSFSAAGGRVYFLPGAIDFDDGRKSVRRLRKFINRDLRPVSEEDEDEGIDLMPHPECGDPQVVELDDERILVLLNSQWWMQDWRDRGKANQGCETKTRSDFQSTYNGLVKKYRTKRLVIAMHHPLESLGPYGGSFDGVDHLLPPIFGSLRIWALQSGLVPQYRGHVMYDSLVSTLIGSARTFGSFVFVSGHERNLQLLRTQDQTQIVSGHSGSNPSRVDSPGTNEFTAAAAGWVELNLVNGDNDTATFFGADGESIAELDLPPVLRVGDDALGEPPPIPTGSVKATYSRKDIGKTSLLQGWVVGKYYRDAYTLKLDYDVLDLSQERGGLVPVKIGGGSQTNSVRLLDPEGGQWALRSTTKDSSRYLPYPMNRVPLVRYFMEDGFTGIHPSAALSVPPMATALGLYHTRPRLLYLPDQAGLGELRGFIGDEVVLLERRPKRPEEGDLPEHLAGGTSEFGETKYRATTDVIEAMRRKPWKHRVDQEQWLRARLLDIFLGDWDRHADQWRFARIKQADGTSLYQPIPRDRDQAMAHYDGLAMFLARMASPAIRRLRPFEGDIGSITWLTYNARPIDALFLNGISRERWMEIATEVQNALTDAVIAEGMSVWPKEAYALHGADLERKLRSRRDQIVEVAERFYAQVNERIDVLGSEKGDRVEITFDERRGARARMRVTLERKDRRYFDREFVAGETDEVRIYALDGKDELLVRGEPDSDFRVRFLGGDGDDTVTAANGESIDADAISVYDRRKGMDIDSSISVDDERSSTAYRNQFDLHDVHHEPLKFGGLPSAALNPDDGLYLRADTSLTLAGFKKRPFAVSHSLTVAAATTTLGAFVNYRAILPGAQLDQQFDLEGTTPQFARNFFGYTNAFTDTDLTGRDFYRVRQTGVLGRYGLSRLAFDQLVRVGVRGIGEFVDIEATEGRFIVESTDVSALELQSRMFAGADLFAEVNTIDNSTYPKRGLALQLLVRGRSDVTTGTERNIGTSGLFSGSVATHIPFDRNQRFVLSTRARVTGIVGDFPFYHAPTLGDRDLRAFNDEQLAGNAVFSHTTDLRIELFRFQENLPGAIGIAAGFDHGTAFGNLVSGDNYNFAFGGTVFWNLLDAVGLSVSYFEDPDSDASRFTLGLGPLFSSTGFLP